MIKNVGIGEVDSIQNWIIQMTAWPCVWIIAVCNEVWILAHLFSEKTVNLLDTLIDEQIKKHPYSKKDYKYFYAWWGNLFNPSKKWWTINSDIVKEFYWNKITNLWIWWNKARKIIINTLETQIAVNKIINSKHIEESKIKY